MTIIAGKYHLVSQLGAGAMGVVWLAVNEATERRVAIKLISRSLVGNEEARVRIVREARACGRISHRNVIEIYDAGETEDGDPFLVMPLLIGETLAARIEREHGLSQLVAVNIGLAIARGLAAAHAAGIVHRDLKPGNIFLAREPDADDDTVKLLDFGVSKILSAQDAAATATGSALGSPAYMSPEQARGAREIDPRSDVWAFGVVLFEMLTGTRPFVGDSPYTVVAEILGGRIPDVRERLPSVDPRLAGLITSCLERDVTRRLESATAIVHALRAFAGVPTAEISTRMLPAPSSGPALPPRPPASVTSTAPILGNALQPPTRAKSLVVAAIGAASFVVLAVLVVIASFAMRQSTPATLQPSASVTPVLLTPVTTPSAIAPRRIEPVVETTSSTTPRAATTTSSAPARTIERDEPRPVPTRKRPTPTATTRLPTDPG